TGTGSLAAGQQANANRDGCFVWGDNSHPATDTYCGGDNQTLFRATGGFFIFTYASPGPGPTYGPAAVPHSASLSSFSDRAAKTDVMPVAPQEVLAQLAQVPITTWRYLGQEPSIRHIGPMAQDFSAAFGVGEDERHISTVDADGVALAAIQGLNEKV